MNYRTQAVDVIATAGRVSPEAARTRELYTETAHPTHRRDSCKGGPVSESALLICVESFPQVQLAEVFPSVAFRGFSRDFEEVVLGRLGEIGFVDWLRSRPGRVLGVRLWLHRDWFELTGYFRESPRVRFAGEGVFELVFREGTPDPELSCDQAFDQTRAYVSPERSLVLALSVDALSEAEVEDVRHLGEGFA